MNNVYKFIPILIVLISAPFSLRSQVVDSICYGSVPALFLNAQLPSGADSNYTYSWQDSTAGGVWSLALGFNNNTAFQSIGLFEDTYFRRKVSALNCGEVAYSNAVEIHVFDPIQVQDALITEITCPDGSDGEINLTMNGGFGTYQFAWSSGDSGSHVTELHAGAHTYTASDEAGCAFTDSIILNVINQNPVMAFSSDTITLWESAILESPGAYNSYAWSNGSNDSVTTITGSGFYTLSVTNTVGCETVDTIYVRFALGLDELGEAIQVKIYPNPAMSLVNIEVSGNQIPDEVVLKDIQGRTLTSAAQTERLMLDQIASGTYILEVRIGTQMLVERIVVQH
jgi:hypothetical protein